MSDKTNKIHYLSPHDNGHHTLCGKDLIEGVDWTNFEPEKVTCNKCKREIEEWKECLKALTSPTKSLSGKTIPPEVKDIEKYIRAKPRKEKHFINGVYEESE